MVALAQDYFQYSRRDESMVTKRDPQSRVGFVVQCAVPSSCDSYILSALLEDTDRPSTDVINDTFDRFGPTPMICIDAASVPDDLLAYEVEVNDALNQVNLERLLEFTRNARNLTMDKTSHKLCLIRRTDIKKVRSNILISPITEHIQSEIANLIHVYSLERQVDTFQLLYFNDFYRVMSGGVFESIFHLRFRRRILIQFMPMVRSDKKRNLRWHASHCAIKTSVLYAEELETKRQVALHNCAALDVCPTSSVVYDRLDLALKQNVYYIPKKMNEIAFDSFIVKNGLLHLFQFTVSPDHDINDKLITRFEECIDVPTRDNWRYIFIIPNDKTVFNCPHAKSHELQMLTPFSAQVPVDSATLLALP
jgi:hypothetical protein